MVDALWAAGPPPEPARLVGVRHAASAAVALTLFAAALRSGMQPPISRDTTAGAAEPRATLPAAAGRVRIEVGAQTRYILSTSGRPSSLERYRRLLQDILEADIAYVPISAPGAAGAPIDPQQFCWALRGLNAIGGAISRDVRCAAQSPLRTASALPVLPCALPRLISEQPLGFT
eukprot:SAG31_NODE_849_length_11529_cov_3.342257_7_plen_175_part_00